VLSATSPPVNTVVEMELVLPGASRVPSRSITGKMRAQRVERDLAGKSKIGFSVEGKSFTLHSISRRRPRIVKPRASKKTKS